MAIRPSTEATLNVTSRTSDLPARGGPTIPHDALTGLEPAVTMASAAVVRRLAALVSSLPVATAGQDVPCPMGAGVTLFFRAAAAGRPVAVAGGPADCGVVHLTLRGQDEPDLSRVAPTWPRSRGSRPALAAGLAGRSQRGCGWIGTAARATKAAGQRQEGSTSCELPT